MAVGLIAFGVVCGVLLGVRPASNQMSTAAAGDGGADADIECDQPETSTRTVGNMFRWHIWADSMAYRREPCAAAEALLNANRLQEKDGWGNRFDVRCSDGRVLVTSKGPDGVLGTSDDVVFTLDDLLRDGGQADPHDGG